MSYRGKLSIVSFTVLLFIFISSCVVCAAGKSTMSADNIQYNINTKKITAVGNVVINRAGAVVSGDKGEGSTENSEFTVTGNVSGSFPEEKADIKSDSLKWSRGADSKKDGKAEAFGKVRITRGTKDRINAEYVRWDLGTKNYVARGGVDAVLGEHVLAAAEAGRINEKFWSEKVKRYENTKQKAGISADRIDGKIDVKTEDIKEATATGNVVIDYIDKEGLKTVVTGSRAVYSKSLGTVVMYGRAKAVRSDGKTVAADKLVVHEDTKNIEAIGNSQITFIVDENKNKDKNKPKGGK